MKLYKKSLWLITIDKSIFFSDIKTKDIGQWAIEKNNNFYSIMPSLEKLKLSNKKKLYIFKDNAFDFNLIFSTKKT